MSNQVSSQKQRRVQLLEGRINQKRRTYEALRKAALELTDSGGRPTLQEVADRAMVSRATVYRYAPSVESLIAFAHFVRDAPTPESVAISPKDPVGSIGRAAEVTNRSLFRDEVGVHVIERSSMHVWLENPPDARPPRPGVRMRYIEPIVDTLADRLPARTRARLRIALAMTMGTEAILAMRDVAGATVEDAVAASRWAAEALVKQALEDASRKQATKRKRLRA